MVMVVGGLVAPLKYSARSSNVRPERDVVLRLVAALIMFYVNAQET